MKQTWQKILALFTLLGAGTFFLLRVFVKTPRTSSDFPQAEKKRLEKKKEELEKSQSELETKAYTDEEIARKFNGEK